MRADITASLARRTLSSVCAAAAAYIREDSDGYELLISDVQSFATVENITDSALMLTAEIFRQIAQMRKFTPHRLTTLLANALTDLDDVLHSEILQVISIYLQNEYETFTAETTNLILQHDAPVLIDSILQVLAGVIVWRATDIGVPVEEVAQKLCLKVASANTQGS